MFAGRGRGTHPLHAEEQVPQWSTNVLFQPLDFLARLATLVPSRGVKLDAVSRRLAPKH
jgi:hypothetical protein